MENKRVLFVDNEESLLNLFKKMFGAMTYRTQFDGSLYKSKKIADMKSFKLIARNFPIAILAFPPIPTI